MSGLVVDLLFQGQLRRTVPFDRPVLRIGRMRENDIVVDSPAVSRFHLQLQLDAGRVFLEDGGSENGSLVNACRVRGRQELAPGDRIAVGDHELRVRSRRLDEQALVDAATVPPELPREELETTELVAAEDDAEVPTAALMEEEVEELAIESAPAAPLFAGLIVQRGGKIDRVVPWEGDEFVVGRSSESDLVLPQDEVSRKHARFVHRGDHYEVHDLGSVNGTLVNGDRVDVHRLGVGDVITIEGFELTFVLDREPISGVMKPSSTAPLPPAASSGEPETEWDVDALSIVDDSPDSDTGIATSLFEAERASAVGDATIANVMLEEDRFGAVDGQDVVETPDVEEAFDAPANFDVADGLDELPFEAVIDQRKELAAAQPRGSSRAASVQDLGSAEAPVRVVTLELRLRLDQLSEPLRSALEEAGANDLVIPADLRLRTD